jgi:hypothetical protein
MGSNAACHQGQNREGPAGTVWRRGTAPRRLAARRPAHGALRPGLRRSPAQGPHRPPPLPQGARPARHGPARLGQRAGPQPRADLLRPARALRPGGADQVAVVEPRGVRVLGPRGLAAPGRPPSAVRLAHGRRPPLVGRAVRGRGLPRAGRGGAGRGRGAGTADHQRDRGPGTGAPAHGGLVGMDRPQAGHRVPVLERPGHRYPPGRVRAGLPAAVAVAAGRGAGAPAGRRGHRPAPTAAGGGEGGRHRHRR